MYLSIPPMICSKVGCLLLRFLPRLISGRAFFRARPFRTYHACNSIRKSSGSTVNRFGFGLAGACLGGFGGFGFGLYRGGRDLIADPSAGGS